VVFPRGRLHSPYGATEALPVTTVSVDEIDSVPGRGACVGRPVREMEVRIVSITDGPIARLADVRELPPGETGEIIVRGPVVTKSYDAMPGATLEAKVSSETADGAAIWHRMGDCGYRDAEGRIWFCGRKAERVETGPRTLHTEPCEQVFRQHPRAARCALIALGDRGQQQPAIVVETRLKDSADARGLAEGLRELAMRYEHTKEIRCFYFRSHFPVDVRHNAKIHRLTLAKWARTARSRYQAGPRKPN
jgi:acyl-CoA synthetase (AMP-forming)/AMP-acid ligase II